VPTFHTATEQQILAGKITDSYFARTARILKKRKLHKHVAVEIRAASLPNGWPWAVFAGREECLRLLAKIRKKISVECVEEGTIFHAGDPVMYISGDYLDFGVYETAVLGLLCQASGIATVAARCRKAAENRNLISFGARRMHPALTPMIERAAFIGGCDGVAVGESARLIGEKPRGTMPHALVLLMGDAVEATRAFHEIIGDDIPTISLIDTFNDEKFEAIRVAEALGKGLAAIRVDTPSSRRGDFVKLLQEIRWELDLRGFEHVKIFASGGLDEQKILQLNEVADGYGVGTHISNAPTVDFALDIVEIEGNPIAKRGKLSGTKSLWRDPKTLETCITPRGKKPNGRLESLLKPAIRDGKLVGKLPRAQEIRRYVLAQLAKIPTEKAVF
jgi:nicotinate phosphoribosyltransferase